MDSAQLAVLLLEAEIAARELLDVAGPITLSPGALHDLAYSMLRLVDTCQHLHRWGLGLLVQAAARQTPPDTAPCRWREAPHSLAGPAVLGALWVAAWPPPG